MTSILSRAAGSLTTNVKRPKAEGYGIRVGDQWFRTVANREVPVTIGSRDSLAQRYDNQGSIYQNTLDIGYAWGRTDLSGGEGLDWDPREIALDQEQATLDPIRYWDSEGINTRRPETEGDQYVMKLARSFAIDPTISIADGRDMTVSEDFIFIADGAVVSWYTGWDRAPAGSDTVPGTGVIAIAAAPNNTVIATSDDGNAYAMRLDAGEITFTLAYGDGAAIKLAAQGIWYVNGRFIMSTYDAIDSSQLYPLNWDGAAWAEGTVIDTASAPFWSVVESGPAIVAACGDGTVRSYTPDNNGQTGTMELLPRSRTTAPEGESPILLGANSGALLIMTTADEGTVDRQTLRLYQAEVLDARFDYVVGQLQLRREWLAVEHEPLVTRNMTNTRDEIFWYVKEEVNHTGTFQEALWRFDLVTNGLTRIVYDEVGVNLNGLVVFSQIVGGIDLANQDIRVSDPAFVQAEGYMIFPNITFGLNTPITWISTIVEAQDLVESGGQVELWRSVDPQAILDPTDPSWVLVQRLSSQGGSNVEVPMQNLQSRTLALQLKIFATEGSTSTPRVSRIAIRGIPAHRDFIMMVPFNISDYVSAPGRRPLRVPGLGNRLHEQVLNLVGANVEAFLLDPFVHFDGVVNNISEPITYQSARGSVTRYCMVEFRGQRSSGTATIPATGDDGVGLGLLGIATVGIGQTEGT